METCETCIYARKAWFDENGIFCIPDEIHGKGRYISDCHKKACDKYIKKLIKSNNR